MRTTKPTNNRIERKYKSNDNFEAPPDEDLMYEEIWLEKIFGKLKIKDLLSRNDVFKISKMD